MRAVLDPIVIISAVLSPRGSPARVIRHWLEGGFELVCSPRLLDELTRALGYPKIAVFVQADEAERLIDLVRSGSILVDDPTTPPTVRSSDPGDDYLIALAEHTRSVLVSGDSDLLDLAGQIPVYSPSDFLAAL